MRHCCSSSLSDTFPLVLFPISNSTFLPPLLLSATHFSSPQLKLQRHTLKRAPRGMGRGSAAANHNFAYFAPYRSNEVYRYTISTDEWLRLPPCPHFPSALVIIDNELTAVGGYSGGFKLTNKLFTLRQGQWVEVYPPMGIARHSAACVGISNDHHKYFLVIGGYGADGWTTTVELLNTHSRRWSTLTSLPKPLPFPSAVICGDQVYVIGGNCVYSYLLSALPDSSRPDKSLQPPIWTPLPDLPLYDPTPAILAGQLVCVSGRQGERWGSRDDSIHQLVDGQWVKIGSLSSARDKCLVVTPSPDRMLVVGGDTDSFLSDSVEMYEVIE